uniref:Uncharacterized protein n=1 Tax=Anguilla anguilla TaxID=7936 RepID=A0A0E9VQH3_ANGAN
MDSLSRFVAFPPNP